MFNKYFTPFWSCSLEHFSYLNQYCLFKPVSVFTRTVKQTSSPKGNDRSPESNVPRSICPQNLMQHFPHPNDATHKIWSRLAHWLQRYSSSKVWNFRHSRASNSKMSGLIRPISNSTELLCLSWLPATLMMIRSKMNDLAEIRTHPRFYACPRYLQV